jgi:hypothetical protein
MALRSRSQCLPPVQQLWEVHAIGSGMHAKLCCDRCCCCCCCCCWVVSCLQVRAFDNDEVVHVDDSVDPVRDLDTIQVRGAAQGRGRVTGAGIKRRDMAEKKGVVCKWH